MKNKDRVFPLGFQPVYMFGTNSICYQRPKAGYET